VAVIAALWARVAVMSEVAGVFFAYLACFEVFSRRIKLGTSFAIA